MIDFLKSWVMNIVTIVILIVLLEMILPSGKTKKFINLFTGFILIIAILNPFLGLVKKGVDFKGFQIAESNFLDKKQIEQDSKLLNDHQMESVTETYRKKIISQLEEEAKGVKGINIVNADVIIDEDYRSDKFGRIKRVYLTLSANEDNSSIKPVAKVKKVKIGGNSDNSGVIKESMANSKIAAQLREKISTAFEVGKENIVIQEENVQ
jgi:stage III sporulation protein AF